MVRDAHELDEVDDDARPAHHLLDPRTGRPAYTGVVQATALAPTAARGFRREYWLEQHFRGGALRRFDGRDRDVGDARVFPRWGGAFEDSCEARRRQGNRLVGFLLVNRRHPGSWEHPKESS